MKQSYCAALLLLLLLAACGAPGKQVRMVPGPPRISHTDEASRLLAENTRKTIGKRDEDYRVGPVDVLEISIFEWELREETKTAYFQVSESGVLSLPIIGDLMVGGMTIKNIKKLIERGLKEGGILKQPRVTVSVKEFWSKRIPVLGAVRDPGVYNLRRNRTTLLHLLSEAGGPNKDAGYLLFVIKNMGKKLDSKTLEKRIRKLLPPVVFSDIREERDSAKKKSEQPAAPTEVKIGENVMITIDLYDLLERGDRDLNVVLGDGDSVYVPRAEKFSIVGFVKNPGIYKIKKPMKLLEAVALSGGIKEYEASLRDCYIKRYGPIGETIIPIDLVAISEGKTPNIYIKPNDIIVINQTWFKKIGIFLWETAKGIFNIGVGYSYRFGSY